MKVLKCDEVIAEFNGYRILYLMDDGYAMMRKNGAFNTERKKLYSESIGALIEIMVKLGAFSFKAYTKPQNKTPEYRHKFELEFDFPSKLLFTGKGININRAAADCVATAIMYQKENMGANYVSKNKTKTE